MLGAFRRAKDNIIIKGILGLTALVMVGFGISYQGGPRGLYAANVNGDVITDAEYSALYANTYRYQQQNDPKYNKDSAQKDRLRENVLFGMITTKLLAQGGEKHGLGVDDELLRERILEDPRFQDNGRFSKDLYERWMNQLGTSTEKFEQSERDRVLAGIFISAVQNLRVSEAELWERFEKENTRVNIEFIKVPHSAFSGDVGTVTKADADEFAQRPDAEDEIKAYYKRFKATKFDIPKKVCARHVLVKAPKGTPPDLRKELQQRIRDAHAAIKGGMPFGEAAQKFSDDANKAQGGDLGCFAAGQLLPQVEQTAFGLKPGELSSIVETPFGYHVIEVTETKEPVRKKLEDVRDEILLALASEAQAGRMAKARAEEVAAAAKTKASLQEAADSLMKPGAEPLKVEETGPFPAGREFLPRLGKADAVAAAAWTLTTDAPVSDPIESEDAWVVIRLKEKLEAKQEDFEQAKLGLAYGETTTKQTLIFDAWSEHLRSKADIDIHRVALSYDDSERQAARGFR